MDVVFHTDEPEKWPVVLSNIPNYLKAAQDAGVTGKVELVINGQAITDATRTSTVNLADLVDAGVTVAACNNAMQSHHVTEADLQPGLTVVPAGVLELAQRQHDGFAYIKP